MKKMGNPSCLSCPQLIVDHSVIGHLSARTNPRHAGRLPAQLSPRTLYLKVEPLNLLEASSSIDNIYKLCKLLFLKMSFWFPSHSTVVSVTS